MGLWTTVRGSIIVEEVGASYKWEDLLGGDPERHEHYEVSVGRENYIAPEMMFHMLQRKWHDIEWDHADGHRAALQLTLYDDGKGAVMHQMDYDLKLVKPPYDLQFTITPLSASHYSDEFVWVINIFGNLDADAGSHIDELKEWWEFMTMVFSGDGFLRINYLSDDILLTTKREDAYRPEPKQDND